LLAPHRECPARFLGIQRTQNHQKYRFIGLTPFRIGYLSLMGAAFAAPIVAPGVKSFAVSQYQKAIPILTGVAAKGREVVESVKPVAERTASIASKLHYDFHFGTRKIDRAARIAAGFFEGRILRPKVSLAGGSLKGVSALDYDIGRRLPRALYEASQGYYGFFQLAKDELGAWSDRKDTDE
jgi:hypothetical protein